MHDDIEKETKLVSVSFTIGVYAGLFNVCLNNVMDDGNIMFTIIAHNGEIFRDYKHEQM